MRFTSSCTLGIHKPMKIWSCFPHMHDAQWVHIVYGWRRKLVFAWRCIYRYEMSLCLSYASSRDNNFSFLCVFKQNDWTNGFTKALWLTCMMNRWMDSIFSLFSIWWWGQHIKVDGFREKKKKKYKTMSFLLCCWKNYKRKRLRGYKFFSRNTP